MKHPRGPIVDCARPWARGVIAWHTQARWVASGCGLALFLAACAVLRAFKADAALLLFVPVIAGDAVVFGGAAAIVAAAVSALTSWELLAGSSVASPLPAALYCLVAAAAIGAANVLADRLREAREALNFARRGDALREAWLAESQHRIGNNLGIVCAALNLQARRAVDPTTRRSLLEASERVLLIAEVNRMLAQSKNATAQLDAAFVERLVGKSIATHGAKDRVDFTVDIEPTDVRPDFVLPIALVLGECVNNALEHGFPDDRRGAIGVRLLATREGKSSLSIWNDGAPLPTDFQADRATTTGLTLILAFARQIGGAFRLENDNGTRATLTF